jgi:bacterioferritin
MRCRSTCAYVPAVIADSGRHRESPLSDTLRTPVTSLLNELLGLYWTGFAQHQTHVALVQSWGMNGLATPMAARISDEPRTIAFLLNRLIDLGGVPDFAMATPTLGTTVREVLDNDMAGQRRARPGLNAAALSAAGAHDSTTRILIEGILADEELHLAWLQTEIDLYDRLGEPLYVASRLNSSPPSP